MQARPANRFISPFEWWLRTGRNALAPGPRLSGIEAKFNPWHDPQTGQFSFGPDGPAMGRRPKRPEPPYGGFGGGDSGGGGASGSWDRPAPTKKPNPAKPAKPATPASGEPFGGFGGGSFDGGGASGSWDGPAPTKPAPKPKTKSPAAPVHALDGGGATPASAPSSGSRAAAPQADGSGGSEIARNGYRYQVDGAGRTRQVSGELGTATSATRSRRQQARAGGGDRRPGDDGGHYIAARFNGPRDAFNHFAQDRNFNRGAYRSLETEWAKAMARGHRVLVRIIPHYTGASQRPDSLDVFWNIGGAADFANFPNSKGGS